MEQKSEESVAERLAKIAEAMKTAKAGNYKKSEKPQACPIDPAERALCEGCQ